MTEKPEASVLTARRATQHFRLSSADGSCERGYIFPRAPEQFVASPLCLVGYVRWEARSDRVPPLQTIIFSSFTGRTPGYRPPGSWRGYSIQARLAILMWHVERRCRVQK